MASPRLPPSDAPWPTIVGFERARRTVVLVLSAALAQVAALGVPRPGLLVGILAAGGLLVALPLPSRRRERVAPGALLLGRHRVDRKLGEGAEGAAWLCHDTALGREVVVKVVPTSGAIDEARRLAALRHPHVVTVHDATRARGGTFIVLEHAEGGTLAGLLERSGPLGAARTLELLDAMLAGLAHAHATGIVHGDLKPENVLLTREGAPKLADFGLARHAREVPGLGGAGTLTTMAPERVRGGGPTRASDVYAMGALAFRMLVGRPHVPYDPHDEERMRRAILGTGLDLGSLPASWRSFLAQALAPDPVARFGDAAEMRRALPFG